MLLLLAAMISCKKETQKSSAGGLQTAAKINNNTLATAANTLQFAGYTWNITNSGGDSQGPGPNIFDPSYAWVDADGFLHLKIAKAADGKYHCAEVTLAKSLGYGTYQWSVEGALGALDKNVVFGMFNYSGNDGFDEMDIEYSKWGVQNNSKTLGYTLYPQTGSTQPYVESDFPFTLSGTYTTQRLIRTSTSATFKSLGGFYDDDTNLYASKTWTNPPNSVSTLKMPILMNLWLYNGVKPSNGTGVEIIIHNFKFTPQ